MIDRRPVSYTHLVTDNFLTGQATASILCKAVGADIFPVDIGVAVDTKAINHKIAYGTKNMTKGPVSYTHLL